MRFAASEVKAFAAVSPEQMAAYLLERGWTPVGKPSSRSSRWSLPVDGLGKFEILLPANPSMRDYVPRMAEVFSVLAAAEDRAAIDVLRSVMGDERESEPGTGRPWESVVAALTERVERLERLMRERPTVPAARQPSNPREESTWPIVRPPELPPPELGSYEILESVGRGGFGSVYRAVDRRSSRPVAIKELRYLVPRSIEQMRAETEVLEAIDHPNVVRVRDLVYENDRAYLVMDFVPGGSLQQVIRSEPLPLKRALRISSQLASALARIHAAGIVHADVTPYNVIVGESDRVTLVDFGLARFGAFDQREEDTITGTGSIAGTIPYMSPERFRNQLPVPEADNWGFGCILYECLTGKRLWHRETPESTMKAILNEKANLEGLAIDTPADIRSLLARCLEARAENRLHDIDEARVIIERVFAEQPDRTPVAEEYVGFEMRSGVAVLTPRSKRGAGLYQLDGPELEAFEAELRRCVASKDVLGVVVDLENVHHLSSVALGALVKAHSAFTRAQRPFVLARIDTRIQHVFVITKLSTVFSVFQTVESAVAEVASFGRKRT